MPKNYTAKDIDVLEGLEPVRKRPGMYIGGVDQTGLLHLVWEALDNAVDEAINGYCDYIKLILRADRSVTVEDNGRGIPIDKHPIHKKPALEIIMTTLHSGAKFSNKSYSSSGGLHGVGISVVNALSERMEVKVKRGGIEWTQEFRRGKPVGRLVKGRKIRGTGTAVTFTPDSEIFKTIRFNKKKILERAETKAFLNSGLSIEVVDEQTGAAQKFCYENGIRDYLSKLMAGKKAVGDDIFYFRQANGYQLECALQWTEGTQTQIYSFANSVYTPDGGAHEAGLRNALTKTLRAHMERMNGKGKPPQVNADDVREGLTAVLSLFIPDPQFQGQTKEKLNNPEATSMVEGAVKPAFERFLLEHPSIATALAERVALSAKARMASRSARESVLRKNLISHRLTLPGKLADCSSTNPDKCELFLVEGDSAGGSSKQARDRMTQAILPLRGKILNVENATTAKLAANNEIKSLVISIGTGIGADFNYSKLRYGKIIIMTDADVDGAHISVLLLTFFFRYMPKLVEKGHICLACPPLYRIEYGAEKVFYALDDAEKDAIIEKQKRGKPEIHRYKGLGEMPAGVLKETTMNPAKRVLLRVTVENAESTDMAFVRLMGKDASARYEFIRERSETFIHSGATLDI